MNKEKKEVLEGLLEGYIKENGESDDALNIDLYELEGFMISRAIVDSGDCNLDGLDDIFSMITNDNPTVQNIESRLNGIAKAIDFMNESPEYKIKQKTQH